MLGDEAGDSHGLRFWNKDQTSFRDFPGILGATLSCRKRLWLLVQGQQKDAGALRVIIALISSLAATSDGIKLISESRTLTYRVAEVSAKASQGTTPQKAFKRQGAERRRKRAVVCVAAEAQLESFSPPPLSVSPSSTWMHG